MCVCEGYKEQEILHFGAKSGRKVNRYENWDVIVLRERERERELYICGI